jgi:hypothetical protein
MRARVWERQSSAPGWAFIFGFAGRLAFVPARAVFAALVARFGLEMLLAMIHLSFDNLNAARWPQPKRI